MLMYDVSGLVSVNHAFKYVLVMILKKKIFKEIELVHAIPLKSLIKMNLRGKLKITQKKIFLTSSNNPNNMSIFLVLIIIYLTTLNNNEIHALGVVENTHIRQRINFNRNVRNRR